jgi:hypothetical protein
VDYFPNHRIFDRLEQFLLKDLGEERPVLQCIPALLVNGGDIVVTKY